MKNKRPRKPLACIHRQGPAHVGLMHTYVGTDLCSQLEFQKPMKDKFSALKIEIWNESYIVWEPFQTFIFQLYKALHGVFQKHIENLKGKPKIHKK